MPRMFFTRSLGSWLAAVEPAPWSQKISQPAVASIYDFTAFHKASSSLDVTAGQKLQQSEDIWNSRLRVFDNEVEHWQAMAPPNDFPAPFLAEEVGWHSDYWYVFTQVGWTNKANCDMPPLTQLQVYEAITVSSGQRMTPPGGGVLMNAEKGDLVHYAGRSNGMYGGTFTGIVRGWLGSIPSVWQGHDLGAQNPGPPPVPPDTKHDPVAMKEFDTALMGFMAISSTHASCLPRPIPYAPPGSHSGIFMPIIMRYLVDRWVKRTVITTIETVNKTTAAPDSTIRSQSPKQAPNGPLPGGGTGFGAPLDSGPPDDWQSDCHTFGSGGPGGYLML